MALPNVCLDGAAVGLQFCLLWVLLPSMPRIIFFSEKNSKIEEDMLKKNKKEISR